MSHLLIETRARENAARCRTAARASPGQLLYLGPIDTSDMHVHALRPVSLLHLLTSRQVHSVVHIHHVLRICI